MAQTSILFLAPTWKYDGYGIAAINRSIINDLWIADPRATKIKMMCILLEQEEGKITEQEHEDARRYNVTLHGAKLAYGDKELPGILEVDKHCSTFFGHIPLLRHRVTHIVGHMPYVFKAAFSMQDIFRVAGQSPKVLLVMHALPRKDTIVDISGLVASLNRSDIVVSVGYPMYREISQHINTLQEGSKPRHKMYIPGGPVELLGIKGPSLFNLEQGPHNILVIGGERENMHTKSLDYEVAVAASTRATSAIASQGDPYQSPDIRLLTIGTSDHERDIREKQFEKIKRQVQTDHKLLSFDYRCFEDMPDLMKNLQISSVCILPIRPQSTTYGVEGIWAAYAGTPLLVSCTTGLANFFHKLKIIEPLVKQHGDLDAGQTLWCDEIKKRICNPRAAREYSSVVQQKCLLDTSISCSHLELIRTILGKRLVSAAENLA